MDEQSFAYKNTTNIWRHQHDQHIVVVIQNVYAVKTIFVLDVY